MDNRDEFLNYYSNDLDGLKKKWKMVHFGKNLKDKDMSKYDYGLFQTGKGLNDRVLQNMVTGRKLRKENALFSYYDKKTSIINFCKS